MTHCYDILPDTADVGIAACGDSLAHVIANTAYGMFSLMYDLSDIGPEIEVVVETVAESPPRKRPLVDCLSELIAVGHIIETPPRGEEHLGRRLMGGVAVASSEAVRVHLIVVRIERSAESALERRIVPHCSSGRCLTPVCVHFQHPHSSNAVQGEIDETSDSCCAGHTPIRRRTRCLPGVVETWRVVQCPPTSRQAGAEPGTGSPT